MHPSTDGRLSGGHTMMFVKPRIRDLLWIYWRLFLHKLRGE